MFSLDFIIIDEKVFLIFETTSFEHFINVNLHVLYFTCWGCTAAMGKRSPILFSIKISLVHLLIVSIHSPLNGFLSVIMSWSVFRPTYFSRLVGYSLRHDIIHNFLSVYHVYTNLSGYLSFLECFNTSVGIKVTDRSFRNILDTLNNLTVLTLWAWRSTNNIRSLCVSSFSNNKYCHLVVQST